MSCCNDELAKAVDHVATAIDGFVSELAMWRKLLRGPLAAPMSIGVTRTVDQETIDMVTFMKYEDDLADLPAAEGRNKDIAKGVFVVVVDGVEFSRTDAMYDLVTRKALTPMPWKAKKGGDVTKRLEFVDDDGNPSPFLDEHFGIATDTIAPDAPTAIGTTRVIDEVEEEDA